MEDTKETKVICHIWDISNRLKQESLDNINESFFADVYRKADRMLYEIVREVQNEKNINGCRRDEQIANVISILGERGRGKTSAMVSFYSYIENLQEKDGWSEFQKYKGGKINFLKIPYIDAAALSHNEFIIEVILAKMWDEFDAFMRSVSLNSYKAHFESLVREVKEGFLRVQKSYSILNRKEADKAGDIDRNLPASSVLHELAVSMNFKKEFEELVDSYIRIMSGTQDSDRRLGREDGYLVLAIDDIDMAGEMAQSILEQIRRFLSIPHLIVLLTADLERLKDVCEAYYQRSYPKGKDVRRFINEYLGKILPTNRRIYMPELQNDIKIEIDEDINSKMKLSKYTEKEMILQLFANKCRIYFDGIRNRRHFLQNDSLRSLVNYFNQFVDMEDTEYLQWLKKDLQDRLIERIENDEQRKFIKELFIRDYREVNSYVIAYIQKNIEKTKERKYLWPFGLKNNLNGGLDYSLGNSLDNSLGQVLQGCRYLENEDLENVNFINCILLWYSIILRQADDEAKKTIIGGNIWGNLENGAVTDLGNVDGSIAGFDERSKLVFAVTEEVEEHINNKKFNDAITAFLSCNENLIKVWLHGMLFVDIDIPEGRSFGYHAEMTNESFSSGSSGVEDSDGEKTTKAGLVVTLCLQDKAKPSFLGIMYKYIYDYKKILKQHMRDGITVLCNVFYNRMTLEPKADEIEQVIDSCKKYIDEMSLGTEGLPDLYIQNVEMLYSISKELDREKMSSIRSEKVIDRVASLYRSVCDALELRDKYYKNEIDVEPNFKTGFLDSLQSKLLFSRSNFSEVFQNEFEKYFNRLFQNVQNIDEDTSTKSNLTFSIKET